MTADRIENHPVISQRNLGVKEITLRSTAALVTLVSGYLGLRNGQTPNIAAALAESKSAHSVFLPNVQNNTQPDKSTVTPTTTPTWPSPKERPTLTPQPPTQTADPTPTPPTPEPYPTQLSTPIINESPVPTVVNTPITNPEGCPPGLYRITFPDGSFICVAVTQVAITPITNTNIYSGTPSVSTPVGNTPIAGTPVRQP